MQNQAVDTVKGRLRPHFSSLLEYLATTGESLCTTYFTELFIQLNSAQEEEDLLELSLNLSRAAFLGFQYDEVSLKLVDQLLEEAEQIAHAFTADPGQSH